eukprot:6041767-Amphidinium_carterae.1
MAQSQAAASIVLLCCSRRRQKLRISPGAHGVHGCAMKLLASECGLVDRPWALADEAQGQPRSILHRVDICGIGSACIEDTGKTLLPALGLCKVAYSHDEVDRQNPFRWADLGAEAAPVSPGIFAPIIAQGAPGKAGAWGCR